MKTAGLICFASIIWSAGCASPVYMHDPDLETQLTAARSSFSQAKVWQTIDDNLKQAETDEIATIRQVADTKRLTLLQNIANVTWEKIKTDSDSQKIAADKSITRASDNITASLQRIQLLETAIQNDSSLQSIPDDKAPLVGDAQLKEIQALLAKPDAAAANLSAILTKIRAYIATADQAVAKISDKAQSPALTAAKGILAKANDSKSVQAVSDAIDQFVNAAADPSDATLPAKLKKELGSYLAPTALIFADLKTAIASTQKADTDNLSADLATAAKAYLASGDLKTVADLKKAVGASKKGDDDKLPEPLTKAVRDFYTPDLNKVSDIQALITAPDSGIRAIRLSLEQESRRTAAELATAELNSEKNLLDLYRNQLVIYVQVRTSAGNVTDLINTLDKTGSTPFSDLVDTQKAFDDPNTARGDLPRLRNKTKQIVEILTYYINLNGTLHRWAAVIEQQIQLAHHRATIAQSQVAAAAYERLIVAGLDGSVLFAKGGITQEEIANWLNALQTIGIGIIAGK